MKLKSVALLFFVSSIALASETIHYSVCDQSIYPLAKVIDFVKVSRPLLSDDEKIIAIADAKCVFYSVHPAKIATIERYTLHFFGDQPDGAVRDLTGELISYDQPVRHQFLTNEIGIDQMKLLSNSLFTGLSVSAFDSVIVVEGIKKDVESFRHLLNTTIVE